MLSKVWDEIIIHTQISTVQHIIMLLIHVNKQAWE